MTYIVKGENPGGQHHEGGHICRDCGDVFAWRCPDCSARGLLEFPGRVELLEEDPTEGMAAATWAILGVFFMLGFFLGLAL